MGLILTTAARNAACNAVVDLVDVGSGTASITMFDASYVYDLVTINLPNPSFGASSAGVATASTLPLTGTGITAGTLAVYIVYDRSNAQMWGGTIGIAGSGADMIVDSVSIAVGQVISITSWTHTQPA